MPAYQPRTKQLVFPKANREELVDAMQVHLPDYLRYEVKDFCDAYGKAVLDLLLVGKQVHIPYLGKFTLYTNRPKAYYNCNSKQQMYSHASITPKFKFVKSSRDRISTAIKQLLIQTLRLPADSVIEK